MIRLPATLYVALTPIDARWSFDRLAGVVREQLGADPRGDAAFVFHNRARTLLKILWRDERGTILLHNNHSERSLRNLALGRHNWLWFANEAGLKWYCAFRSLIASCALHGLNPETYLEGLLRLAPHWPVTRMIELSPKYWSATVARLEPAHRAALARPWEVLTAPVERATRSPRAAA